MNNQTTISLDSVRVNLVFVWSGDDVCQVDVNKMAGGRKRVRPWDLNKRLVLGSVALPPGCSLTHTHFRAFRLPPVQSSDNELVNPRLSGGSKCPKPQH